MNNHWMSLGQSTMQAPPPETPGVMTFLFGRKKLIVRTFLLLFALAIALLYLLPQSYTAQSNLLVERNRSPIMRGDYAPGLEMVEAMNTARGIASSETVIRAVVETLGLADRPKRQSAFTDVSESIKGSLVDLGLLPRISPRDKWIQDLMNWLIVKPVVNSNILSISLSLEDPELAAEIVNSVSEQYIKHHLSIYSTRGLAEFYRERMNSAESEYKEARQSVLDFKSDASLFAVTASREEYTRELGTLRTQLLTATNDLNRLLNRYGEGHSEITVTRDVMAAVEERIQATEEKLRVLERNEATLSDLEMRLDSRRKTYLDYVNKYGDASISQQADTDLVNVRLVEPASVPPQPWMPRLFLIMAAALASAFLAIALGFFRGYFDSRPATPDEVERALGVPVVGWLENLSKSGVQSLRKAG